MPLEVTSSASTSSPLISANPTSEPSKYIVHAPLVFAPNAVGVNSNTSSSLPPVIPVTVGLPVVEINTCPLGSRLTASIFSAATSSPTSMPLRYMLNVPAVTLPSNVASKRRTSRGVTEIPLTVKAVLNDMRSVSESTMAKANRSEPPTPTSEPSKNRLQFAPSKRRMSSSAEATPPTVALPVNER